VSITGVAVPAVAIDTQLARICPLNAQWKWEAIPHDATSFLVNFPSFQDLERVNGIQMDVPDFEAQFKIPKWEIKDIQTKFDLPQLWVHVEGVPHAVRHFHGLWAIGSLLGITVDVDLPSLYSQNVVQIKVAMMNLDILNKHQDDKGFFVDVTTILKFKGYDLRFWKQKVGFKPDPSFTPFFWRRKDDDLDEEDPSNVKGKGPHSVQCGSLGSQATSMEVDGVVSGSNGAGSCSGVQRQMAETGAAIFPSSTGLGTASLGRSRPGSAPGYGLGGLTVAGGAVCHPRVLLQLEQGGPSHSAHADLGLAGLLPPACGGVPPLFTLDEA
jgi:hypothetical protein